MDEGLIRFLARHFVSICVWHGPIQPTGTARIDRHYATHISAFVISVRDIWFLVTAGHVVEGLEAGLRENGHQIKRCRLVDHYGPEVKHKSFIPFEYDETPKWVFGDQRTVDYAVFYLNPNLRRLLEANAVTAVAEPAWRHPPENLDAHFLIGIPRDLVRDVETHTAPGVSVRSDPSLSWHGVEKLPERPEYMQEREYPRSYGIVAMPRHERGERVRHMSIEGESGGPIFGLSIRGKAETAYWVVGVQSSWHAPSRTIAWCPLELLADQIDEEFGRIEQKLADGAAQ